MSAYLIADIEVTDPVAFEDYCAEVLAVIAAHGGRYLVRGGATEVLEGNGPAKRHVIVEFPDIARLKAFYDSVDYQPLKSLRQRSSKARLVAIEGL
jgi:uncharacterized protein (DUF1330 family)